MKRKTTQGFSRELGKKYGHLVRETTYFSIPPKDVDDRYFVTQVGDRLDLLAQEFYGNRKLWWYIGLVNNLTEINVEAGVKIRIPKAGPRVY